MVQPKVLPSTAYLQERLIYDPDTGALTWRTGPRAGKPAGCLDAHGYLQLDFGGSKFKGHRVIYKMMTGEEPPETIDHKDRNPGDNRWEKLRPANQANQNWNRTYKAGASGFLGVSWHHGKWVARIRDNYTTLRLGRFDTPEEAAAAYEKAARELRGEFHRRPLIKRPTR